MDSPTTTEQIQIELRSIDQELAGVRRFCAEFMDAFWHVDGKEDALLKLQLAANEAVANVTEHGYAEEPGQPITCIATRFEDRIELEILHHGARFTPPAETPVIDWPLEGGMGLYLIEQTVDQVTYCETDRGEQCIRLTTFFNRQRGE